MKRNFRFSIWTILTLFVLAANAVHPQVAYADDGTPPPDTTETVAPTEEISTPEPIAQATEDIFTPQPAEQATETPTPTPTTEDAPPVDETPIVALLPENTDLIVLDEDGLSLPLASQQAADAIVVGDPIWCPAGAAPTPGSNGCTASYSNLYNLIDAITTSSISEPGANGTIWITNGADNSSSKITIDGSGLTTWANYALTIQGGWNGVSGDTTISGSSIFDASLKIVNWSGAITLNDLTFSDTGDANASLSVNTQGDIQASNVTASNNSSGSGANLEADGNVRITNSFFNENVNATGLYVDSQNGFIELVNVEAVKNHDETGASLLAQQNVTVTGGSFNNNGNTGLGVVSVGGSITLNSVTAEHNDVGANLFSYQNVAIAGGSFSHNTDSGLFIAELGSLTLSNVTADDNSFGALLYAEQDVDISDSSFSANGSGGLFAISNSGSTALSNITVEHNGISGAHLIANQNATVAGSSFSENDSEGLHVEAGNGWIALSNVIASRNGDNGATLLALGNSGNNITVSNSVFNDNDAAGLGAYTGGLGSIYLENVTVNNNLGICLECDGFGTSLETNGGSIAVLNGSFSGNGQDGIFVSNSGGADVTISCARIEDNDGYGVQVAASATPLVLELNGAVFSGNGSGDYVNANGTGVIINTDCAPITPTPINTGNSEANSGSGISSLPWRIIPVKAEENERKFGLDCVAYRGSILALSDFDFIALPCPIGEQASFEHINQAALPAPLEDGLTFVAALNGKVYEALDGTIRVGFFIPAEKQNASYAILHWDGSKWTNLQGVFAHDNNYIQSAQTAYPDFFDFTPQDTDGFFVTSSTRDGVFVLVTK